jgi:hypothetical protein
MTTFKRVPLRIWAIIASIVLVGLVFRSPRFKQQPEADHSSDHVPIGRAKLNLALVEAVKKRDLVQVKTLLARGANPNARDQSALHHWKKRMSEVVPEQDAATGELHKHPRGDGSRPYLGPSVVMIAAHQCDNATG